MPYVSGQHLEEIVPRNSPVVKSEGRDTQALLVDFGGRWVVTPVGSAPHIAVMCPIDRVKNQPLFVEDGVNDSDIGQMTSSKVRVVQNENVAFSHCAAEVVSDGFGSQRQRADVDPGYPLPGPPTDSRHREWQWRSPGWN